MSYQERPSRNYYVVRRQGRSPVRVVRHSLTKKKAEQEASFLNEQFRDRKDIEFAVRQEGWNKPKPYS